MYSVRFSVGLGTYIYIYIYMGVHIFGHDGYPYSTAIR